MRTGVWVKGRDDGERGGLGEAGGYVDHRISKGERAIQAG